MENIELYIKSKFIESLVRILEDRTDHILDKTKVSVRINEKIYYQYEHNVIQHKITLLDLLYVLEVIRLKETHLSRLKDIIPQLQKNSIHGGYFNVHVYDMDDYYYKVMYSDIVKLKDNTHNQLYAVKVFLNNLIKRHNFKINKQGKIYPLDQLKLDFDILRSVNTNEVDKCSNVDVFSDGSIILYN